MPYRPAVRLPLVKKDLALRTKPQLAVGLVKRALGLGVPFRVVVADSVYGESAAFEGELWGWVCPMCSRCARRMGPGGRRTPRTRPWTRCARYRGRGAPEPGRWMAVERRFRDGHIERWWAADLELAGYEPGGYT